MLYFFTMVLKFCGQFRIQRSSGKVKGGDFCDHIFTGPCQHRGFEPQVHQGFMRVGAAPEKVS